MKRLILFVIILNSVLAVGQNQGNFSKLVVRDWIIYQGDTLAVLNVSGDTIFVDSGQTAPDTLILHNYWTKTGNDIINNNTGKVTITGDSLYFFPLPDVATKVGRIPTLLTTGEVQWATPLQIYEAQQDTIGTTPGEYGTWVRDTVNERLHPATLTDNVGIGTAAPEFQMQVTGALNATDLKTTVRDKGALITFTFDDGRETNYLKMLPLFTDKGIAGSVCITTDWIGTASYMSWTQVQAMQAAGWEVMSHSKSHPSLIAESEANIIAELKGSKDTLMAHGLRVKNLAYPYNNHNLIVRNIARKYYRGARAGTEPSTYSAKDSLNSNVLTQYNVWSVIGDTIADSANYRRLIEKADTYNYWLVFYIHDTDAADSAMIASLINFIQARNIDIVTFDAGLDRYGNNIDIDDGFQVNGPDFRFDGTIYEGNELFMHRYSDPTSTGKNLFMGYQAGNVTLSDGGGDVFLASYNQGFGYQALNDITTGYYNNAFGYQSQDAVTTGYRNISMGSEALGNLTEGYQNIGIGHFAGSSTKTGNKNIYIGDGVAYYQTGSENIYIGLNAGYGVSTRSTASTNTAVGTSSMYSIRGGDNNAAFGYRAMYSDSTGADNVAVGDQALYFNLTGSNNIAVGSSAGYYTKGAACTFIGGNAGFGSSTSTASYNTGLGYLSMNKYTTGGFNTSVGAYAGYTGTTADSNTYVGLRAGYTNSAGSSNTMIGARAGYLTTGNYNVMIGNNAGYKETGDRKIYIASDSTAAAFGMRTDSKLLMYADMSNAAKSAHFLNIYGNVAINAYKTPTVALDVTGSANISGYLVTGQGGIADNDATPDVSGYNNFIYMGTSNPVTITDLDNPVAGAYYVILGSSDTYTVTIADSGNFKLSASCVLGVDDVITLFCKADNYYIEVSRSNN